MNEWVMHVVLFNRLSNIHVNRLWEKSVFESNILICKFTLKERNITITNDSNKSK